MSGLTLIRTGFRAGRWEGLLTAGVEVETPRVVATHHGSTLGELVLKAGAKRGEWAAFFDVPRGILSEGVQTILFVDAKEQATLESFTILSGDALAADIRAEQDLLREELELLKRAFRRHCNESS